MTSTMTRPDRGDKAVGRHRSILQMVALPEVRWAAAALALFAVGALLQLAGAPPATWWASYLLCYAAGGWEPGLAGVQALRERTLDVDLLMIVAAVVAASIGQVFDGALLIVIFSTSGALEAVATKHTRDSVTALLDLAPDQATRLTSDGGEEPVPASQLMIGDLVLIRPGERIGADGTIIDGRSEVDQASITGEPLPAFKQAGAEVFAGTVNGTGALRMQVARAGHDSVIARIVAMVEQASATKARTQLFIEKVEQRYSVAMVTATLALFIVPLLFGAPLQPTLLRAITFMIVASPCAVVLATMPPLLSAIANAGRHGVLVKSAVVMEQLGASDTVAFDKTGTLTAGTPTVTAVHLLPGVELDERQVLTLAAASEQLSEHPVARAIVTAAHDHGITELPPAHEFTSTPGRGVQAIVERRRIQALSPDGLTDTQTTVDDHLGGLIAGAEAVGRTAIVVVMDAQPIAVLALADQTRPDAAATVAALRSLTAHPPVLLTGDNDGAATLLASATGIDEVRARLLPADKVAAVNAMQAAGQRVLVIGDGVNDAPAMAAAHLGIAMGRHSSDVALDTADAVIVRDELATVPAVITLSRRARRVVKANLVVAAAVITGLVIWDLTGHLPLPLAVAGHEGSTVIVGLNGLRLLRATAWIRHN